MANQEFPNGYFCTYRALFCREGYRSGCEMCLKSTLYKKREEAKDWTKDVWESRTAVATSLFSKLMDAFA